MRKRLTDNVLVVTFCVLFAQCLGNGSSTFALQIPNNGWDQITDSRSLGSADFFPGQAVDLNDIYSRSSGIDFSLFMGLSGSKQTQDFGVNANFGGQASVNLGVPLVPSLGISAQLGTGVVSTGNAVQVFELLGETSDRFQSFTTIGLFQRLENGFSWGFAHDYLFQESFDEFSLSQWRIAGEFALTPVDRVGVTAMLESTSASGTFAGTTLVTLTPITQGKVYWRHFWDTGAQTTTWIGIADEHGEDNAVTGPGVDQDNQFLFGSDLLMPLTDQISVYGEANIIFPVDTGAIDAFLGFQWRPRGSAIARRGKQSPLLPLASPATFTVDLDQ